MALGPGSALKSTSVLQQLLEEINFQRTKEMRQLLKDGNLFKDGFYLYVFYYKLYFSLQILVL